MDPVGQYEKIPFPKSRVINLDYLDISRKVGHYVYGLLEVDVTVARNLIHEYKKSTQQDISFTAWLLVCIGKAVAAHPHVQAMLDGHKAVVTFQDVDISIMIEKKVQDPETGEISRAPMPLVVRKVQEKTVLDLTREIRAAQEVSLDRAAVLGDSRSDRLAKIYPRIPKFLRKWVFRRMISNPFKVKEMMGTIVLTSVGMFGKVPGWPITKPVHPLGLAVGSITTKPRWIENQWKPRDILHLTAEIDHNVIDGGPAARFLHKLVQQMELGFGIPTK